MAVLWSRERKVGLAATEIQSTFLSLAAADKVLVFDTYLE